MDINSCKLIKIDFNEYDCEIYAYNKKKNSIAMTLNTSGRRTNNVEFIIKDENLTKIIQSDFLDIDEKLKILNNRILPSFKTEDIVEYGDTDWELN